jgi:hypothetical protein
MDLTIMNWQQWNEDSMCGRWLNVFTILIIWNIWFNITQSENCNVYVFEGEENMFDRNLSYPEPFVLTLIMHSST